jgi:hypothetical protein
LTERKVPRRMAWRVMMPKMISTMFSHQHPVGVKCKVIRWLAGSASHARTSGCLCVPQLSRMTCRPVPGWGHPRAAPGREQRTCSIVPPKHTVKQLTTHDTRVVSGDSGIEDGAMAELELGVVAGPADAQVFAARRLGQKGVGIRCPTSPVVLFLVQRSWRDSGQSRNGGI